MLFEPGQGELIKSGVLHELYKLLNEWIRQDNDVLRNEYDRFVTDNKNKGDNGSKNVKETETQSGWEIGEPFELYEKKKTKETGWNKTNQRNGARSYHRKKKRRKNQSSKELRKKTRRKNQISNEQMKKKIERKKCLKDGTKKKGQLIRQK